MDTTQTLIDACDRAAERLDGTAYDRAQDGLAALQAALEPGGTLTREALLPAWQQLADDARSCHRSVGSYNVVLQEGTQPALEQSFAARRLPSVRQLSYILDAAKDIGRAVFCLADGKDPATTRASQHDGGRNESHMQRIALLVEVHLS